MSISTPNWVKDAVFYQIFPDRFARVAKKTAHYGDLLLEPWNSAPSFHGYKGGNLWGIIDRLPYLKDLGINALYLNPIFQSAACHRYHTHDYYQVDPLLGGNEALKKLLHRAHKIGMRVVLDGVFNHASRGFFFFHDIMENSENSPWLNWFKVNDFPLFAYNEGNLDRIPNYSCWENLPALPTFNHDNPAVREYLMRVGEFWIKFGIDGWRLDVPELITAEGFWQEFRSRIKAIKKDAYIVGEIWTDAQKWLDGSQFDGVMNYPLTKAIMGFTGAGKINRDVLHSHFKQLKELSVEDYATEAERLFCSYDKNFVLTQLNLLDSHDTARFFSVIGRDIQVMKLAVLLLFTSPGVPSVYYGDEIGLEGGHDPDCRRAFPWDGPWNQNLLDTYKVLIKLRRHHIALRRGAYRTIYAKEGVYIFGRIHKQENVFVAINNAKSLSREITFKNSSPFKNIKPKVIYGQGRVLVKSAKENHFLINIPEKAGICFII